MRSAYKDLAIGLVGGFSLAALAAASAMLISPATIPVMRPVPSSTQQSHITVTNPPPATNVPSPTAATTSTITLEPTLALVTSTPDIVEAALRANSLIFEGPLSQNEQAALYRASLKYIRFTPEESRALAKEINGVGYGDPSNICGPLAIAILRDANLIPADIVPHDFWLLDPNAVTDARILEHTFPWNRYSHVIMASPINKIDWRAWPLLPGDFVFIWHGSGGNFDHMLVITRVDSESRTYAVTNYGTPNGYIISEAMLYDPNDPSAGLFRQWTAERNAVLGSTGFGGFEVWRRRSP